MKIIDRNSKGRLGSDVPAVMYSRARIAALRAMLRGAKITTSGSLIMIAVAVALALSAPGAARSSEPAALKEYVAQGLRDNLALKEKDYSYEKSLQVLREARGMFMPSISIEARYSRAGGGREILFPIGDLMNPVYGTLNQLLAAGGLPTQDFPTLRNEVIPFLREEEQETKVRLVQPLFQPAIYYNHGIRNHLSRASLAEREAFKRQLEEDIRTAYYNYLKTLELGRLLGETMDLLKENLRVSEKLFDNGMVAGDAVLRAKAEVSELGQQISEAGRDRRNAGSYFNFLLNRDLDSEIIVPEGDIPIERRSMTVESATIAAESGREELRQFEEAIGAAGKSAAMATSEYLPSLTLVFDYGFQGEEYSFTADDDYWMGSLVLQWDIFSGLQRDAKRDQAKLEKRIYETRLNDTRGRIRLQVRNAVENLDVAWNSYNSALDRLSSSRSSFNIVRKKYKNGMAPQIEFLDARNNLTGAEVNLIIAKYDYHIRLAHLERVTTIDEY